MRYIFLDSSTNNGGIENFIIESIDYIIRYNKKVSIITYGKKSLYEERFRENRNVDVIFYKNSIRTDFKLEYKIKKIKKQILKEININIDEEYCIITPYFTNLQIAMYIFKDIENVKILHIWGHPEDWINTLNIKYNILNHKKKKYQKSLLKSLNASNSDFYGAEVVPIYNSKFYDVNLKYNEIDTFPIVNIDEVKNEYYFNPNSSTIKILWVGRFDYWKNESIIHIAKEIEYILDIYPKIDIEFDIVGAGKGENDKYLRDALSSYNVKVKYHGLIESKCLSSFMKNYDIGIGMGLTVKKMAQIGLPAIVIDSVDKEFKNEIKCEWLFNTKNGDAGDGYYLKKAGFVLENRKFLKDILLEIIKDKNILNIYSKLGFKYVKENYSQQKQLKKLLNKAENSRFNIKELEIYKEPYIIRCLYSIYDLFKGGRL